LRNKVINLLVQEVFFSMHTRLAGTVPLLPYIAAATLGIFIAAFDVVAPFGDDSEKATLLFLVVFSGHFGFLEPLRPWRWALAVGLWLPLGHLALHAFGFNDTINPNTYGMILLLIPVSLAACLVGAYTGAFLRRIIQAASATP
jgi:hypothetical protein